MKKIEVNGTDFVYLERGQGDPVVLVHGTLGDFRSWEPQLDTFAKKYRTISYSRRYHYPYKCDGNESDYSPIHHADDLSAFLRALGLESAHIVGNSYGAYTAMFHAARHPEQVRALVLSEPPALPLLENSEEGSALRQNFLANTWQPAGEAIQRGETEKGIKIFMDGVVAEGAFDSFPSEVRDHILENACEFKAETSSANYWVPLTCKDIKDRITIPTLLLTGEKSLKMLRMVIDELKCCLPNNELVTIPESSHEMASESPDTYNKVVLNFLAKHSR